MRLSTRVCRLPDQQLQVCRDELVASARLHVEPPPGRRSSQSLALAQLIHLIGQRPRLPGLSPIGSGAGLGSLPHLAHERRLVAD